MQLFYNKVLMQNCESLTFRDWRKLAVRLKINYVSFEEGDYVDAWGGISQDKVMAEIK